MPNVKEILVQPDGIIYRKKSALHNIAVIKAGNKIALAYVGNNDQVDSYQTIMDINQPLFPEIESFRVMLLGLILQPNPRSILMIGFAGGHLFKLLRHYLPEAKLTAIEIDADVVEVAKQYFDFKVDSRTEIHIGDGREWLEKNDLQYDIIIIDAYYAPGITSLETVEFHTLCTKRLHLGGIIAKNSISSVPIFYDSVRTMAFVYPRLVLIPTPSGNAIALGHSNNTLNHKTLVDKAKALQDKLQLPFSLTNYANSALFVDNLYQANTLHDG